MSDLPLATAVLSSEERWNRWEQRGRDSDARFMRQARWLLSAAITLAIGGGVVLWLLR